jgi:transporter family protein
MLVVATVGVIALNGDNVLEHAKKPEMRLVVLAGVCLAVGILAYYRALARGPVSLVTPIFGLFLVISSLVGVVILNEPLTARKAVGVVFAVVAVVLVAGE